MTSKKIALLMVFTWFFVGGIGHFMAPDFFLKIVPPSLPLRIQAVYISGFFELLGALGLLHVQYRKCAGIGLFVLTITVTPANVYMWLNPQLFPKIPELLLGLRLILQALLLAAIWWAAAPESQTK
ncbi:putative membrane protein [Undibacterium sp. GrIS 1.8]|uniref:DoxX family protein n=1 Tax=Undibacterium sp. GrIS 1.8 TaxID=3143934 RepID=UPI0033960DAA